MKIDLESSFDFAISIQASPVALLPCHDAGTSGHTQPPVTANSCTCHYPFQRIPIIFIVCSVNEKMIDHILDLDDPSVDAQASKIYQITLLIPYTDQDKSRFLHKLGNYFLQRYIKSHSLDDLTKAVSICDDAVRNMTVDDPARIAYLRSLRTALQYSFQHLGDIDHVERSIVIFEEAVQLSPDSDPNKPSLLQDLSHLLLLRFTFFESDNSEDSLVRMTRLNRIRDDINKAIQMLKDAIRISLYDDPAKPELLCMLGDALSRRFERFGSSADIDEAVAMKVEAVRLIQDQPPRASYLNSLSKSLRHRFRRLGARIDIDKSISMSKEAIQLTEDGHPHRPDFMDVLGGSLLERFERLGDVADLDRGISIAEKVLFNLTSNDDPSKPGRMNNLGRLYLRRFRHTKSLLDLEGSILMFRYALHLIPLVNQHPLRSELLDNLSHLLFLRFESTGEIAELSESISLSLQSIALTPEGHPERPERLGRVANSYLSRFRLLNTPRDLDDAISYAAWASYTENGPPSVKLTSSLLWAECALLQHNTYPDEDSGPALLQRPYAVALQVLPHLANLGLPLGDRHHQIMRVGALVRNAAATALKMDLSDEALEWLEQGRCIIWGQILQLRSPIDELRQVRPDLAERLEHLSKVVEKGGNDGISLESSAVPQMATENLGRREYALAFERQDLLEEIRRLPDFKQFLMPKKLSQLIPAARAGSVITLNISVLRCDALILKPATSDVFTVPLPDFSLQAAEKLHSSLQDLLRNSGRSISMDSRKAIQVPDDERLASPEAEFGRILGQLWLHIVKPVVDHLELKVNLVELASYG